MNKIHLIVSLALVVAIISPIEAGAADLKKLADELVNAVGINKECNPISNIDIIIDQPQLTDTLSKKAREDFSKAINEVKSGELQKGDNVSLIGFGTFSVSKRSARSRRNEESGQSEEYVSPENKENKKNINIIIRKMGSATISSCFL